MAITIDKSEHPQVIIAEGSDGQIHLFNQFYTAWCAEDGDTYDEPDQAPTYESPGEPENADNWCRSCMNSGLEEGIVIES